MPPARPPRSRRALVGLGVALALVGALELAARALVPPYPPVHVPITIWSREHDLDMALAQGLHRFDVAQLWAPRPGAGIPWAPDERVSPQGFRGADPDPDAVVRVLTLGDSSTFGYGVAEDETYSAQLEARLAEELCTAAGACAPEAVQVVDGGVVGTTILQGLARYRAVRERWTPRFVVLAFGAINEQWESPVLDDAAKLALVRERDTPLQRAARWVRANVRLAHLAAFLADRRSGGRRGRLARIAEEHADEVRRAAERAPGVDYPRRVDADEYAAALRELHADVTADGGELVLLHMVRRPSTEARFPEVLDYDPVLRAFAAETGATLVEAHDRFHATFAAGAAEEELFCDAFHPNAAGHARLAELLHAALAEPALAAWRAHASGGGAPRPPRDRRR